mmetsp:Transcript_28363/g.25078  ORF Transcript_28363/g.25078 Transcript_28363/m.25078 type:complete len:109 (-) Transcript_28363:673-999(-)
MLVVSAVNEEEGTIHKEEDSKSNMLIGTLFALIAVLALTTGHTITKILSITSPYITPNDQMLFMGLFNVPFSFIFGLKNNLNMNLFSYPKFIIFIVFLRGLFGLLSNA